MEASEMLHRTISTLRVSDARASEELFCGKLGFHKTWEYDPGDGYPVFIEVTRDSVSFHLSEHEGDGPMGIQVYVSVSDALALYDEFTAKGVVTISEPSEAAWGELIFELQDLDGNTLRFGSLLAAA